MTTTVETTSYLSWGRAHRFNHHVARVHWLTDDLSSLWRSERSILPFGLGRSYGDSCLNEDGILVDASGLSRILSFDRETGRIACEAGVTLAQLLDLVVPAGWFLPVSPGTKYVTIGGAIANDVHGKSHHATGTFGEHVTQLELARSDGSRTICSPVGESGLFRATIGGLGLTGLITWAEIQLVRVSSPWIEMEAVRFQSLAEFQVLAKDADARFLYTVAWIDCLASGPGLGRGIFFRGNHAPAGTKSEPATPQGPLAAMPIETPELLLNPLFMRAFNGFYFNRPFTEGASRITHYEPFFYPLDKIKDWNKLYGKRGFYQFQFVLPTGAEERFEPILKRIAASGGGSFLAVLKSFGHRKSPGLLSFPMEGLTLALDFANRGPKTLAFLQELDREVLAAGGRIYPAKDGVMSKETFAAYYPEARGAFKSFVDPRFSSSFWRRVT